MRRRDLAVERKEEFTKSFRKEAYALKAKWLQVTHRAS
jgi:hypothetical protein